MRLALILFLVSLSAFAQPTVSGPTAGVFNPPTATSSSFNPATDPTTVEYLTADAITGLTDGQTVATWQHTVGNDGLQTFSPWRPFYHTAYKNGLPSVVFTNSGGAFNGLSNSLPSNLTQPYVFTVVFQFINTNSGGATLYAYDGNQTANRVTLSMDTANFQYNFNAGTGIDAATKVNQNWHVVSTVYNGASSTWWLDGMSMGTLSTTTGSNQAVGFNLGARFSPLVTSSTAMGAFLVSSAVPASGISAVHTFFISKWGTMGP